MTDLDTNARLYLVFAAGLGVALVGAVNALFALRLRGQVLAAVAGCGVATGFVACVEPALASTAGAVGGVLTVGWLAARSVAGLFRSPRVRWAGVAALGLAVAVAEVYRFEQAVEDQADLDMLAMVEIAYRPETIPDPAARVVTDAGTPVAVETAIEPRAAYELRAGEEAILAALPVRDQFIRRAPPGDTSNCHGWVFTGGRYVVRGADVDRILTDNRYTPTTDPRPGDVCVYRDEKNGVTHTALVQGLLPDGTVLVEGKWGFLGVFLHPAGASTYGTRYTFYRSDRSGHLLAGVTEPATAVAAGE